jgi:hypothetical protein
MADALGKDEDWIEKEVAEYAKLAGQYVLKPDKIMIDTNTV